MNQFGGRLLPFANPDRTYGRAAKVDRTEPNSEVRISRCARSQNEIRRDRILFSAATRRENQPFIYVAARRRTRIYRLRTFLPSVSQEAMIAVSKQEILGQELLVVAVKAVTVREQAFVSTARVQSQV